MTSELQLINPETSEVLVPELRLAATFWTRLRGLQFRKELPNGEGLLIVPCRSVHTHWMRFAIDVVMIDANGQIIEVRSSLRPWQTLSGPRSTRAVLEVPADSAAVIVGDRVAIRQSGQDAVPIPARFLLERT